MFTLTRKTRILLIAIVLFIIVFSTFKFIVAFERIDAGNAGIRVNLVGSNKFMSFQHLRKPKITNLLV
jgi:hypothetical protein